MGKGSLVIRFLGDVTHLEKSTTKATRSLQKMRGPALGITAGVTGLIASSVNLEKQFSQSMNLVAATTKAPAKEMKSLQDLAIKLGKDTSFSANEAGDAMLELAKGGLSAADIKAGGLKGTLTLAAAGGTDLATAAGIAANALNTFGLKGKDMSKVSAALAGGANASTASVESLGMALSQVGPGAKNAGLSINDTVGALAAFDSAGIKGSDAGTSLKTMLTRLVPQTAKAAGAMKKLGLDFTDSKGKFLPLTEIAQQLKDKLGGLSQEQRTTAMATIFGSDATRAATVLMGEGAKGLEKYIKATKDKGAAERAADARMKGTAGALERLSGSWETLRLTIGMMVAPAVVFIADKMGGLTNFLTDNSKAVLVAVGVVGAFAIAILAANAALSVATTVSRVWTAATVVATAVQKGFTAATIGTRIQLAALAIQQGAVTVATKVAAAAQWVMNAAMSANPIGLVIAALAALVAGLVWFFTKTKAGKAIIKAVWGGIKAAIKGVADWWTKTAWPAIKSALKGMGDWFKMVGRVVGRVWRGIGNTMGTIWRWIKKNVIDKFILGLKVWALVFKLIGAKVAGYFGRMRDRLGKIGSWIRERVFGGLRAGLTAVRNWFGAARDNVTRSFGRMRDGLRTVGAWIRKHVFGGIRSALGALRNGFRNAVDKIRTIWDRLKSAAARPVNFLIKWVWNKGLRKVLTAIPGVDLPEVNPIKFAKGGAVTGGVRGRDSVPAMYMPGEHVWTAKEVRKVGGQTAMYGMRKAALEGRLEFAKGGALSSEAIARAQSFARQQSGKPYGWGAVGPSSYDCSGFMSALTNVLQGQSPHRRRGATADFPWAGFKKGPGQFTIGSTANYAGSGIGHMSGNLAGMGVESRGGRGVILGPGAMNPSGFPSVYHLGQAGKGGASSWWDNIGNFVNAIRKLPGQIQEMMSSGSWISTFLRKIVVAVSANVAKFINDKIPNGIPFVGDNPIKPLKLASGGIVRARPGGTHALIGEGGRDEAVIPLTRGRADDAGPVQRISLEGELGDAIVKIIRRKVKSGGGSVQLVLGR